MLAYNGACNGAVDDSVSKKTVINVTGVDNRDARGRCLCNVHIYAAWKVHLSEFSWKGSYPERIERDCKINLLCVKYHRFGFYARY